MPSIAHPSDPHEASFACSAGGCSLVIEDGSLQLTWPEGRFGSPWPAALPLQISRLDPELLAQVNAHLAEHARKDG